MGLTVIYAVLIFSFLIFVHELGHFIAAKLVGIKVNEFSLGMGPLFLSIAGGKVSCLPGLTKSKAHLGGKSTKDNTKYSLRVLPIGGFVKMEGEDEDSNDPRAFNKKNPFQRALVLIAGSFMNLLTTVVLIAVMALSIGMASTVIDQVSENYPAEAAGIIAGDRIVRINGQHIGDWSDVTGILGSTHGDSVIISVKRGNEELDFVSGIAVNEDGRKVIGITSRIEHSPGRSLKAGVTGTWDWTKEMFNYLKLLFIGQGSMDDLVGPVGIVSIINDQAKMGFFYIINLAALISLNLAIVNMLPLPALDGGRLLFLVVRQVTGRRITDSLEEKIHFAGLMLLFALMVYLVIHDVDRFILN